jgi:hypothetical protein
VAKLEKGRWMAKFVARLIAMAALWVRIQTSLKTTKMGDISQHTLARQKIYKNIIEVPFNCTK